MNATKYTFDTNFNEAPGGDGARRTRQRALSDGEVAVLCETARAEGAKAAEVLAHEALAQAANEAVRAIKETLVQMARERQILLEQAANLALVFARKLANAALSEFPQKEVEATLREAMHQALGEPRVVLKAAPDVAELLGAKLTEIAHEEGYDGRLQVSADPSLKRADCRIEWRGGGAERSETVIEAALEEMIARNFRNRGDKGATHGKQ